MFFISVIRVCLWTILLDSLSLNILSEPVVIGYDPYSNCTRAQRRSDDVGTAMYIKGQKVESDIELWHKWFVLESREAASAEEGSHDVLLWRRTCVWKIESNTIRTERERGTKSITLLSKVCATVTNEQQPLQKVTKSLYIVTHLGLVPFIRFT